MYNLFLLITLLFAASSYADELPGNASKSHKLIQVVTTFSVLSDLVKQIGGEHVEVYSLVGWDEDAHVFHPSPSAVKKLARADLLIVNGLGFEGWLDRLVSVAQYKGVLQIASEGIDAIHLEGRDKHEHHGHDEGEGHGDDHEGGGRGSKVFDPHAWLSLKAVRHYLTNISSALQALDPNRVDYYRDRAQQYSSLLNELERSIDSRFSAIPQNRHVVIPHNAFAYLARDYGLHIHSLKGLSTESESSAAQIARTIREIRSNNIRAIFSENIVNSRIIETITRETGVKFGGNLISGALSKEIAPTYLAMMRHNANLLIAALER